MVSVAHVKKTRKHGSSGQVEHAHLDCARGCFPSFVEASDPACQFPEGGCVRLAELDCQGDATSYCFMHMFRLEARWASRRALMLSLHQDLKVVLAEYKPVRHAEGDFDGMDIHLKLCPAEFCQATILSVQAHSFSCTKFSGTKG